MDEREVRALFFDRWAEREDGDKEEAVAQTYFAVAMRIVATLDIRNDSEFFWEMLSLGLRMKTDLCRKEMYPGRKDLDPVPFGQRDEPVVYRVLNAERDVLKYISRHLTELPASPFKERHTRQSLEGEITAHRRELEGIVREFNVKQYAYIPRVRVDELVGSVNELIEALLGVPAYDRFAHEFNSATMVIRLEQARPVPKSIN